MSVKCWQRWHSQGEVGAGVPLTSLYCDLMDAEQMDNSDAGYPRPVFSGQLTFNIAAFMLKYPLLKQQVYMYFIGYLNNQ